MRFFGEGKEVKESSKRSKPLLLWDKRMELVQPAGYLRREGIVELEL